MNPPIYPDEAGRLIALQRSALLDTAAEERFDRIIRLTAQFFQVKTCLFSLVDSDRQWFKSRIGMDQEQISRDNSFAGYTILNADISTVVDAAQDSRFATNPMVINAPYIRFYAGAPINDASGKPIGTLCVMDPLPRHFSTENQQALRDFADMIEHEITRMEHIEVQQQLSSSKARTKFLLSTLPDIIFVIDKDMRFVACNEHPDLLLAREKVLGKTIQEVLPEKLAKLLNKNVSNAFSTNKMIYHNYTFSEVGKSFEARFNKTDENEVLVIIRNITELKIRNTEMKRLSQVAKQTTNSVVITDSKGLIVWVNEAFTTITEYTLEDIVGKKPSEVLQGPDTDVETTQVMAKAIANQVSFYVDVLNYSKSKRTFWTKIACNPLWDDDGALEGYIAIQTDITQEKLDAEQIRNSENLLKAVIEANSIGTWRLNFQTGELLINDMWAALLGYTLDEIHPTNRYTWENLTHPDDLLESIKRLEKHVAGNATVYENNIRMRHKNGDWVWINTRGKASSFTDDGKPEWLLGTHFDINAQIRAESKLNEKSKQMQAIVENMLDGVISINSQGVMLTFNQAAEHIFGYSSDEVLGENISLLINVPYKKKHSTSLSNFILGVGDLAGRNRELEAVHKNGTVLPIELGLVEVKQLGEINFIGIVRDITERKERDNEIHQLAFYDPLTLLPNRRLLLDRLNGVIANCNRQNRSAALMFLDLDNFKNLNDSAGHHKGDLLLSQVAERLCKSVRRGDTVSRLGGDEFVLVVENLSSNVHEAATQAEAAAEKIQTCLLQSYDLDGLTYNCTASIGVTMLNNEEILAEELLKQADMAMYKAKTVGRNGVQFFDPNMQISVSLRAAMEQDLHNAIQQQQFQLYYQKQVNQLGQTVGFEALIRWLHPDKGIVSPVDFIPLAEETGLINQIGQWVLQQACQTLAKWATDPLTAKLTIAVNLSVVQFRKNDIVKVVLDALTISGANPNNLKLEITETLLVSNVPDVKAKMQQLQLKGISFSIDDFGTGYSSLSYLKQLPINQLKIDQSFVKEILDSPNDKAIAQAVITLAESLCLSVIAEGVETEAQRALLHSMGCNIYQGYLFGKPCALEDLDL